jgi:hypothetical protein
MIQIYFTIIEFCLFSLGVGCLKMLTEARLKIIKKNWQKFEHPFEHKKLLIRKKVYQQSYKK